MKKRSSGTRSRTVVESRPRRPKDIAWALNDSLDHHATDARLFSAALGRAARLHGMSRLAESTGLTREGLYKALAFEGNPSFDTVMRVVAALGVRLSVAVVEPPHIWVRIEDR